MPDLVARPAARSPRRCATTPSAAAGRARPLPPACFQSAGKGRLLQLRQARLTQQQRLLIKNTTGRQDWWGERRASWSRLAMGVCR